MSAWAFSNSPNRWLPVVLPADPNDIFCSPPREALTRSATDLIGDLDDVSRTLGSVATPAHRHQVLARIEAELGEADAGREAHRREEESCSRRARRFFATTSAPAPGRRSTITFWPRKRPIACAMLRPQHVGRTAGGIRDDHADRPVRIVCRPGRRARQRHGQQETDQSCRPVHSGAQEVHGAVLEWEANSLYANNRIRK